KAESSLDDLFKSLKSKIDSLPKKQVDNALAFTDSYGVKYHIPKDTAELWLKTFNLKSLEQAYIPSFTPEVKQALDSVLQGEEIRLTSGSLLKLIKEYRLKYLDRIKSTLEQPQRIILQNDGALIFARKFGEEKYFTSVARSDSGEWIIRSNAPKSENGLNNKISAVGKEIYNSQAANQINAHSPYDDIAKSNIKLDSDIIPQTPQEIIKQAKQSGKSVAESSLESTSQISKEIKDIIDSSQQKGRDMVVIGKENFTPEVVEYAHKNNKKIAIDKLEQAEAEKLGFKYPNDVRITIDYSAINHTLNRHGAESALVKNSGQKAVDYTDIAEYRSIVKGADETLNSVDNMGTPVVVSYKQINGHFVVIEEIRKGQNELNFKTMFKQDGNYKDSESYKKTSQSSNATEGYEPTANSFALTDDIIPQKTLKGDSITNPDISYAIKNENITKELAEKIANGEIDNIRKRGDVNIADVSYYDKDNMTMYSANIGNYIDDDFGMKGDRFFLSNINKNEFYIPPTKSLQDFKEQSLNQIESLKHAIKTEIDNVRDEKELHKNIKEIKFKARGNAERRFFDDSLYKEQTQAREFYTTQYDEVMQEMQNYYNKKFTNILNEIDFNAPTKQVKTQ
ncbi:PBECR2 nuclease fold domain-containing protein, partial [Helicobacter labetoulli]|uniref:PBECR3 domain-containing polyvalent protein n=1 Tax=Helicobacter labetoulli TaxID=2315333 RepID=UPI000EF67606